MRNKTSNAMLRANHKCRMNSKVVKTLDFHKEKDKDILDRLEEAKEEEGIMNYIRRVIRNEIKEKNS